MKSQGGNLSAMKLNIWHYPNSWGDCYFVTAPSNFFSVEDGNTFVPLIRVCTYVTYQPTLYHPIS